MSWQECVLGTIIKDPGTYAIAEELTPSDFTGVNQKVWNEIAILGRNNALGERALIEALRVSGVGNPEELVQSLSQFSGNEIDYYVKKVLSESLRRSLQKVAALIAMEAKTDKEAEEIMDFAEKEVMSLRRHQKSEGVTMANLFGTFMNRVTAQRDGSFIPAWQPHTTAFREHMPFAESTEFIVLAARPGEGKSSYLRFEAFRNALNKNPTLIINLENDEMEYAKCFVSLDTGIVGSKLKDARRLNENELETVKRSAQKIAGLPIKIVTMPGCNITQIQRIARKFKSENENGLIMLDYIQLVRNGNDNRVQDVSETTGGLRSIGLELGMPILAASQLSRSIETRSSDDPMLSDLRDSGSVEQDPTVVAFIRQVNKNPTPDQMRMFPENVDTNGRLLDNPRAIAIRFFFGKNRNGSIGVSSPMKWDKATGNIQTLQRV